MSDNISVSRLAAIYWQDLIRGKDAESLWASRAASLPGADGAVARATGVERQLLAADRTLRGGWRYEAGTGLFGSIWICEGGYPVLPAWATCYRFSFSSRRFSNWKNDTGRGVKIGSQGKGYLDHTMLEPCELRDVDIEALVVGMYAMIAGPVISS